MNKTAGFGIIPTRLQSLKRRYQPMNWKLNVVVAALP
jgi:hypothetical protein